MYQQLNAYLKQIGTQTDLISAERKAVLESLASYISKKLRSHSSVDLVFICTHNSRRSQLAQVWAAVAAHHFGLTNIHTHSAGTEVTAFHPNAVAALQRAGLQIEPGDGENPAYKVYFTDDVSPLVCFSKTLDHGSIPSTGFAAVMTCADADANCPFVPNAELRVRVTYEDPKVADGTPNESAVYDERCKQIATEMFYAFSKVPK